MEFLPADYAVLGLTLALAVTGLFRGFSGTLAFVLASAAAAATGTVGWPLSANWLEPLWARGGAVLVATLLVFGLVRTIAKRLVNGLLAQPSDALFGFVLGAALGVLALAGWAMSGFGLEYSNLATLVSGCLK